MSDGTETSAGAGLTASLTNYDDPHSFGSRLRRRRLKRLLEMVASVSREKGGCEMIDIGGTRRYWNIVDPSFLETNNVRITIVNQPGVNPKNDDEPFRFIDGDGCDLSQFRDLEFDIAHSNSVIEHVGQWRRMVEFAAEVRRVATRYFIQTPNYWFPVEPHYAAPFFHWLPFPARVWLLAHFSIGAWPKAVSFDQAVRFAEDSSLLTRKMMKELFPDAKIEDERFLLFSKSLIAIRD